MKTIIKVLLLSGMSALTACTDLTMINERLDSLDSRVTAIEKLLPALNANVSALKELAGGSTINSISEPNPGVYEIILSNGTKLTLNQGSIGIGKAPVMSIDKDGFWMADYQDGQGFQYVLSEGDRVPALGKNGITPQFGVDNDGYWTVSYDEGKTFSQVKGVDGKPVKAFGAEGASDSYFSEVRVENNILTLVLKSGKTYQIPVLSDFLFAIKGVDEIQLFNPGDTKSYQVEKQGVEDVVISKPNGWEASLSDLMLTIKAPQATRATIADSEREVAVLAISSSGYSTIAKVKIQLSGSEPEMHPTASLSAEAVSANSISFKILTEDVTKWYYIFQKTAETPPDATKLLSSGVQGSGRSLEMTSLESKTSYSLYVLPMNGSELGTLATLNVTTLAEEVVLYSDNLVAWNEGKTINIAGEKYSKALYGEATVITAESVDTELTGLTAGVYILDAANGCNFIVSHTNDGLILKDDIVLIGRYNAKKPQIKLKGFAVIGGLLAARDLLIDCSESTKNYKFAFSKLTSAFHIDACTIIGYGANQTGYLQNNLTKSFRLVNSNVKYNLAQGKTAIGLNFSSSTKLYDLKEITVENNIFCNPVQAYYQLAGCNNNAKLDAQTGTPGGVSISLCNNTFYNFTSSSAVGTLIYTAEADLVTIDKNIFWTALTGGVHRCVRFLSSELPSTINFGADIAYGMAYASAWRYLFDSTENLITRITDNPFETVDVGKMIFTPIDAYADFGAKRDR